MSKFAVVVSSVFFLLLSLQSAADKKTVAKSEQDIRPLLIGQKIPDVKLRSADKKTVELKALVSESARLLIFYRGGWCPYCNAHLGKLAGIQSDLESMGIKTVGISPDKPKFLKETQDKGELKYLLLSDASADAITGFGLAYAQDVKTRKKYKSYNIDIAERSGNASYVLPVPAAYLVDKSGEVQFAFVAPDYTRRIDTAVLLAAAKAMTKK